VELLCSLKVLKARNCHRVSGRFLLLRKGLTELSAFEQVKDRGLLFETVVSSGVLI